MFNFLKKDSKESIENPIIKITALLIHVAKIDENYTEKEKEIIRKSIVEIGSKDEKIDNIFKKAEEVEKNSTWGTEGEVLKLEIDPKSHSAWTGRRM